MQGDLVSHDQDDDGQHPGYGSLTRQGEEEPRPTQEEQGPDDQGRRGLLTEREHGHPGGAPQNGQGQDGPEPQHAQDQASTSYPLRLPVLRIPAVRPDL